MDCRDIQDNLFAYAEGTLSTEKQHAIEEHARQCTSCARLLEAYGVMEAFIREEKNTEPNPFTATRILQHLENRQESRARFAPVVLRPVLVTLALLFAITLGVLIGAQATLRTDVVDEPVEMLKTELFIDHFLEEDLNNLSY